MQLFDNDADNEAKIISITPCIKTLASKVSYNFNEIIESDNLDDSVNEDSDDEDDDIEDIDNEYKRFAIDLKYLNLY